MEYEITDQALEAIVARAVQGVKGVRILETLPRGLAEVFRRARPIRVERTPEGLSVEVYLAVEYGQPIPRLAQALREEVAQALHLFTGERVKAVNLTVAQVEWPKEAHAAQG